MKNSTTNTFDTANSNAMLGDGFLVPMTDFVLELEKQISNYKLFVINNWIFNYAKFIKQPIKEEMFFHLVSQPTVDSYMQPKEMKRQYNEWKSKYDNKLFDIDIDLSTVRHHKEQGRTIEYFCQFNNVKLTEKALNIIFGKTIA